MREVLAWLLAVGLTATSGAVPLLHTHRDAGDGHPEHRHGLAAHAHAAPVKHHDDHTPGLEPCDPAQHVVPFSWRCAVDAQADTTAVERPLNRFGIASPKTEGLAWYTDVRVHGPPPPRHVSPRAPPLIVHA